MDDWQLLQNKYYRKFEIYSLNGKDLDLSSTKFSYFVRMAPCGGPIAVLRQPKKSALLKKPAQIGANGFSLNIYNSSGRHIHEIEMDMGHVVDLDWLQKGSILACFLQHGQVRLYDMQGDYTQLHLGNFKILGSKSCSDGIMSFTSDGKFVYVHNLMNPRPIVLDAEMPGHPTAWELVPSDLSLSLNVQIILGIGESLYLLDSGTQVLREMAPSLTAGSYFCNIKLSPNGKLLVLFSAKGEILVLRSDFSEILLKFDTESTLPPHQLVWCGDDAVIAHWDDIVLLLGPGGDWIKYSYNGMVHLVSEIDGVRIISEDKVEFLERLRQSTVNIFDIGSTAPAAMLYEAWDNFEKRSPKSHDIIRSISKELPEAIDQCIDAAAHEFNSKTQKSLLRAAVFGKIFSDEYGSDKIFELCRNLRVLNAARAEDIGIPLSYEQFMSLKKESLIDKLLEYKYFYLCFKICGYWNISRQRVLMQWATQKLKSSTLSDDELCDQILSKLRDTSVLSTNKFNHDISFASLSRVAYQAGRCELSFKLLSFERRISAQVELLLAMKKYELALQNATKSRDLNLILSVVIQLKSKLPLSDFFEILNNNSAASKTYESYLRRHDEIQLLRDLWYQDDRNYDIGVQEVLDGLGSNSFNERISKLQQAAKNFSVLKEHSSSYKSIDNCLKLLKHQENLEKRLNTSFRGFSACQTILKLVRIGEAGRAAKLKNELKMSEPYYRYLVEKGEKMRIREPLS